MLFKFALLAFLASSSLAAKLPGCKKNGQKLCGGQCVDVMSSSNRCGDCKTKCMAPKQCVSGTCALVCGQSEEPCGNSCVNTQNDGNNCGSCGNVCDSGQCNGGSCTAYTCTPGTYTVDGRCFQIICGMSGSSSGYVGGKQPASNVRECVRLCAANSSCKYTAFQHEDPGNYPAACFLYTSGSAYQSDSGTDVAQECAASSA